MFFLLFFDYVLICAAGQNTAVCRVCIYQSRTFSCSPISSSWWQKPSTWRSRRSAGSIPFLTLTPEQKGDIAATTCFPLQHSKPFQFLNGLRQKVFGYMTVLWIPLHLITLYVQVPTSLIFHYFLRSDSSCYSNLIWEEISKIFSYLLHQC